MKQVMKQEGTAVAMIFIGDVPCSYFVGRIMDDTSVLLLCIFYISTISINVFIIKKS
jgi:hypothetical protein